MIFRKIYEKSALIFSNYHSHHKANGKERQEIIKWLVLQTFKTRFVHLL